MIRRPDGGEKNIHYPTRDDLDNHLCQKSKESFPFSACMQESFFKFLFFFISFAFLLPKLCRNVFLFL